MLNDVSFYVFPFKNKVEVRLNMQSILVITHEWYIPILDIHYHVN